jgi:hypothetical protein
VFDRRAQFPRGILSDPLVRLRHAWDTTCSPFSEVAQSKNAAELVAAARAAGLTRKAFGVWLLERERERRAELAELELELERGLELVAQELERLELERLERRGAA